MIFSEFRWTISLSKIDVGQIKKRFDVAKFDVICIISKFRKYENSTTA